jgi:hypothetical protein
MHKQRGDTEPVCTPWVASRAAVPPDQYTWPAPAKADLEGNFPTAELRWRKVSVPCSALRILAAAPDITCPRSQGLRGCALPGYDSCR